MAIKDLIKAASVPSTPGSQRPPGITCEKYTRGQDKHCLHYAKNGACLREDEFMCVEWLKANGGAKRPVSAAAARAKPAARDLLGCSLPEASAPAPKTSTPHAVHSPAPKREPASQPRVDVDQLRGFTTEDIESFKALGVEVLLRSDSYGDLWLVPAYTGRERNEITPEHAATLARVLSLFPGSHIVSFEKPTRSSTKSPEPPKPAAKENL